MRPRIPQVRACTADNESMKSSKAFDTAVTAGDIRRFPANSNA
jgi:hypothetical protein